MSHNDCKKVCGHCSVKNATYELQHMSFFCLIPGHLIIRSYKNIFHSTQFSHLSWIWSKISIKGKSTWGKNKEMWKFHYFYPLFSSIEYVLSKYAYIDNIYWERRVKRVEISHFFIFFSIYFHFYGNFTSNSTQM